MSSSTAGRQHLILVVVAVLAAACDTSAPATTPPSGSPGLPSSGLSGSQAPSVDVTPDPSCPTLDAEYIAPPVEVNPRIGRLGLQLQVTGVVPHWDPTTTFVPRPRELGTYGGVLPGGYDMPTELWLDSFTIETLGPPAILAVDASITPQGGSAAPLAPSVVEHNNAYWLLNLRGVPDLDGNARLDVAVEWRDGCFTYAATGGVDVVLVSTAVTGSCPMEPEGFYRQLAEEEFAPALLVGEASVDIMAALPVARYIPEGPPGGDGPWPFHLWDREVLTMVGPPGAALTVVEDNPRVELTTMASAFYVRRQVVRLLETDVLGPIEPVFRREVSRRADGSFRLRLPSDPGRYVVWLAFDFESTCATGIAWSTFAIDVIAPPPTLVPSPTPEGSPLP